MCFEALVVLSGTTGLIDRLCFCKYLSYIVGAEALDARETDGSSIKLTSNGKFAYVASLTVLWRVPVAGGALERVLTTDTDQLGPYVLDGDSFIIALTGKATHVAGLLRTSTKPEVVPTQ